MSDATNLALIYSRLADLESQRDSTADILQTITQKHSLESIDEAEAKAIDEKFRLVCNDASLVDAIKLVFEGEHKLKDEVVKSLTTKAAKYHSQKLNRDQFVADSFRLRESLKTLRPQVQDMSELCRSLQALDKEKGDHHAKILAAEQQKTAHIESECGASLTSVTTKIDAEEADINAKAQENEELRAKLEQFRGHLELRREKVRNEQRTKELTQKLEAAKLAQKTYLDEQEKLKRDACKSKIVHTGETVLQLGQQLQLYDRKFAEFESTLTRTNEIMAQLAERELSLLTVVGKLRAEHADWAGRASQAEVGLVTVLDQKKAAEEELAELKAAALRTEKKCRKLQARRKEVITAKGGGVAVAPSTAGVVSSAALHTVAAPSAADVLSSSASPARHSHSHSHSQAHRSQAQSSTGGATTGGIASAGPLSEGSLLGTEEPVAEGLVGEGSPVASPVNKKCA